MKKILILSLLLLLNFSLFAQSKDSILFKCNISNNIINENGITDTIPINIIKNEDNSYTIEVNRENVFLANTNSIILFYDGFKLYKNNRYFSGETLQYNFSLIEKSDLGYLSSTGEKSYRLFVYNREKNEMKYSFLNIN